MPIGRPLSNRHPLNWLSCAARRASITAMGGAEPHDCFTVHNLRGTSPQRSSPCAVPLQTRLLLINEKQTIVDHSQCASIYRDLVSPYASWYFGSQPSHVKIGTLSSIGALDIAAHGIAGR